MSTYYVTQIRPNMLHVLTDRVRSMADRKAELERKKAKLQALREEKERRRIEKAQRDVSRTENLLYVPKESYITCRVRNLDMYIV